MLEAVVLGANIWREITDPFVTPSCLFSRVYGVSMIIAFLYITLSVPPTTWALMLAYWFLCWFIRLIGCAWPLLSRDESSPYEWAGKPAWFLMFGAFGVWTVLYILFDYTYSATTPSGIDPPASLFLSLSKNYICCWAIGPAAEA